MALTNRSLSAHLLSLYKENQKAATTHPFLERAGKRTLELKPLQEWLIQDRFYALVGYTREWTKANRKDALFVMLRYHCCPPTKLWIYSFRLSGPADFQITSRGAGSISREFTKATQASKRALRRNGEYRSRNVNLSSFL